MCFKAEGIWKCSERRSSLKVGEEGRHAAVSGFGLEKAAGKSSLDVSEGVEEPLSGVAGLS